MSIPADCQVPHDKKYWHRGQKNYEISNEMQIPWKRGIGMMKKRWTEESGDVTISSAYYTQKSKPSCTVQQYKMFVVHIMAAAVNPNIL
jgi:hypothetical protein